MANTKSYYEILEVRDDASQEVIKMAYKALCLKYHPDTTKLDKEKSYAHMQKINAAYEILSDEERRTLYDIELKHSYGFAHNNKETESGEGRTRKEQAERTEASRKQAQATRAAEQRRQQEARKQQNDREAERLRKEKLFEEKRKAEKEKRKKILDRLKPKLHVVFKVLLAVSLVSILVYPNIIQPLKTYADATDNMDQGKYVYAYSAFLKLDDFKDSKEMALECIKKLRSAGISGNFVATVLMETDNQMWGDNEYEKWIEILEDINRYGDYDQRGMEAKYQLALLYYYQDAFYDASKIFMGLNTYKLSEEYLTICEGKISTDAKQKK